MTYPERASDERFPNWLRTKDKVFLLTILGKEPIDLRSPAAIGGSFVSKSEIQDVYDIINQVQNPLLVGLYGSRANLRRPPLFENVEAFDRYYGKRTQERGLIQYLQDDELSITDYQTARGYLETGYFNERYRQDHQFPEPIVRLLVRDIDLLIIGRNYIQGGILSGRRTNVHLDVLTNSRAHNPLHDAYPSYFHPGLGETVPLVY